MGNGLKDFIYPHGVFIWFLLGNFILSYSSLGLIAKLWVFLIAVGLPLAAGIMIFWGKFKDKPPFLFDPDENSRLPLWLLALIFLIAIFFRFYQLETLSTWPRLDEGLVAFEALPFSKTRGWNVFSTYCDLLPAYSWIESLFLKVFGISLGTLWFFPALISTLTVGMAYSSCRQYFSKAFSLLMAPLIAGAFWPAYIGRFSHPAVLMVFWEIFTFYILALLLKIENPAYKPWCAALLGCCVGIGFYTYPAYLSVAVLVGVTVFLTSFNRAEKKVAIAFTLPILFGFIPIWASFHTEDSGNYYKGLFSSTLGEILSGHLASRFSYIGSIFWGQLAGGDYGPVWGGFLNPVVSSFFFLGLMECFHYRKHPLSRWLVWGLALALVPAFCTNSVEYFRISVFWPLGFTVAGWGFYLLVSTRVNTRKIYFLPALLLIFISTGLDFWHLFQKYPEAWAKPSSRWGVNIKSVENWGAFQRLRDYAASHGRGAVLEDLEPDSMDRTLTIADQSFDTALNPQYGFGDTHWVSVITNVNYSPFLRQRFPDSSLYKLPSNNTDQYGGDILVIIPLEAGNTRILSQWFQANREMQKVGRDIMARKSHELRGKILNDLSQVAPFVSGDPFLESCFWEKAHVQENLQAAYGDEPLSAVYPQSLAALQMALQYGCPVAHLYNELGVYLELAGQTTAAQKAFEHAIRAPINITPARQNLDRLNQGTKPKV